VIDTFYLDVVDPDIRVTGPNSAPLLPYYDDSHRASINHKILNKNVLNGIERLTSGGLESSEVHGILAGTRVGACVEHLTPEYGDVAHVDLKRNPRSPSIVTNEQVMDLGVSLDRRSVYDNTNEFDVLERVTSDGVSEVHESGSSGTQSDDAPSKDLNGELANNILRNPGNRGPSEVLPPTEDY
jgi:hypothetical protein